MQHWKSLAGLGIAVQEGSGGEFPEEGWKGTRAPRNLHRGTLPSSVLGGRWASSVLCWALCCHQPDCLHIACTGMKSQRPSCGAGPHGSVPSTAPEWGTEGLGYRAREQRLVLLLLGAPPTTCRVSAHLVLRSGPLVFVTSCHGPIPISSSRPQSPRPGPPRGTASRAELLSARLSSVLLGNATTDS